MAAEELAALKKERKEVARRSGLAVSGEDNLVNGEDNLVNGENNLVSGEDNLVNNGEDDHPQESSSLDQETAIISEETPRERNEENVVVPEKANQVSSEMKQKAENRLSFDPDRWNLKVPQGIPPHIAQSAFELYDQELRGMPDKEFKDFLKDWSPNSPMYLYLRELRRKVR